MGKEKAAQTSNCDKLREATVVTSEIILELLKQYERVDAAKTPRKSKKVLHMSDSGQAGQIEAQGPATIAWGSTPRLQFWFPCLISMR